jgi:hypothetical protein
MRRNHERIRTMTYTAHCRICDALRWIESDDLCRDCHNVIAAEMVTMPSARERAYGRQS